MSLARTTRTVAAIASLSVLAACSLFQAEYPDKQAGDDNPHPWNSLKNDSVFGDGGISILSWGNNSSPSKDSGGLGIGVNAYLWRASLDTLSFLPLVSADPFGGTILTDWYAPPESPHERFKMNVYITDRDLHADGIHVSVFRQTRADAASTWIDATVTAKTQIEIENAILTRARELRAIAASVKKPD
jgi:hypothetical protein